MTDPSPQKEAPREHKIVLAGDVGERAFLCRSGHSLLREMERQGLRLIPVGCRGGGCGVCKVRVVSGKFERGRMSNAHVSEAERRSGSRVLACQVFPASDLSIEWVGS